MSPEVSVLLGKIIDGVLSPVFVGVLITAFISYRNGQKLDHVQDGMKSALDKKTVESDDAKIAQATAEGQEKGRLLGESEAAARK